MTNSSIFFSKISYPVSASLALLILRSCSGLAFIFHGIGKIQAPFSWMGPESSIPGIFQALAATAEFAGGIAWILGLVTPLASLGIFFTMSVAVYIHAFLRHDPFVNVTGGSSYELALIYWTISIILFVLGPGKFSLDAQIKHNSKVKN